MPNEAFVIFNYTGYFIKFGKSIGIFGNADYLFYPSTYNISQSLLMNRNLSTIFLGKKFNDDLSIVMSADKEEDGNTWNSYVFRVNYKTRLQQEVNLDANISYANDYAAYNGDNASGPDYLLNSDLEDVPAFDINVNLAWKDFLLGIDFFKANGVLASGGNTSNAKPELFTLDGSYKFMLRDSEARFRLGYEKTKNSSYLTSWFFSSGTPESHYYLGVDYNPLDNFNVGIRYDSYKPYSANSASQTRDQEQVTITGNYYF
jgi:hypothetical protein